MYFVIYTDDADEYRWHLKADNGRIIADSGQGYSYWTDCNNGINLVKSGAANADVIDIT